MDAKIKKIVITPAKFDENGDIKSEEFATLTLDVPMDSTGQRQAIIELTTLLDKEWVKADIRSDQSGMERGQIPNAKPQQAEIPA